MPDIFPVDLSQKQQLFVDALRETGTIRKAAAAAHVGRSTVNKWRSDNVNGFREQFNQALDDFVDGLEDDMFSLLKEMKVGHNPTLLIFALKALRPLKYRELTQIPDENARELLRKLEAFTAKTNSPIDEPESQLTALQQVAKILRDGA